jgi:hypothetical protein
MEQIKDLITHDDIVKDILKYLKKERMSASDGKRIMKVSQIPPVLLQKNHPTYKKAKDRIYAKLYYQMYKKEGKTVAEVLKKNDLPITQDRVNTTQQRWTKSQEEILVKLVDKFGHDNGCVMASRKLGRTFSSCKCKYASIKNEKEKEIPVIKERKKVEPISVDITKDIVNFDINGYNISITYKNGSTVTYNVETQSINIKHK